MQDSYVHHMTSHADMKKNEEHFDGKKSYANFCGKMQTYQFFRKFLFGHKKFNNAHIIKIFKYFRRIYEANHQFLQ